MTNSMGEMSNMDNAVYIVYYEYGYGERSTADAVFSTYEKAREYRDKQEYDRKKSTKIVCFTVDEVGGHYV